MKKLVDFFYEVGSLRKIARSHRQALLTDDLSDNIASHSYRAAVIGYFLAKREQADPSKVMLMCLLHDAGETRSGDQNWIHKRYVRVDEDRIIQEQLADLTEDNEALQVATEYAKRETLEAKIAKDADLLDQALLVQEYVRAGNQEAKNWFGKHKLEFFSLDISRQLYQAIITTSPTSWWQSLYTNKRQSD